MHDNEHPDLVYKENKRRRNFEDSHDSKTHDNKIEESKE